MTIFSLVRKLLLFCCLSVVAIGLHAAVIYVDSSAVSGANNGTSWPNAFRNLNSGITASVAGDTIWVAKGTYYPANSGQQTISFTPKRNVGILGGFSGFSGIQETSSAQRNFLLNRTILSGDLDKSGTLTANDSYHIIAASTLDSTAYLDGFTLRGGNAEGGGANGLGGAIFSFNGGMRIINCRFEDNHARVNGGACYLTGSFIFENCIFLRNDAVQGGALSLPSGPDIMRFKNCVFADNVATDFGGVFYIVSQNTLIEHCTFLRNTAPAGACIRPATNPQMRVRSSIFWGNTGPAFSGTLVNVRNCLIQGGYPTGTNILNVDPNFSDSLGRIYACSPAVDAADSAINIVRDFDGNPRPFDGDNNGIAKWDLGAFEASIAQAFPASNPILGGLTPCLKTQNSLYHVTTDNSPLNSYLWTLTAGGTISGTNANDSVNINWGNTLGSYLLTVLEKNLATGCATTNSTTIVPDSLPVVTLNPAGPDSICIGDSLLITGNGNGVSRQWYFNGNAAPGQTTNQTQAQAAGIWNMLLTDGNGCSDSAVTALNLYLRPLPIVTLTTNVSPEICLNDTVTITGTAGQSHQWYLNGSPIGGATTNTYGTGAAGSYNMLQTDVFGCRDSASTPVDVFVNALPVVTVSPSNIDTICIGDSLAISANAGGITTFQWQLSGSPIPSSNFNIWQANTTGYYNVIVTDTNNCQDSASIGHILISDDFENPVANCQPSTLYLDGTGAAVLNPAQINNGSTDNCKIDSFALSLTNFGCIHLGVNPTLLMPIDPAGNRDTCTANVTVFDTLSPTVICNNATIYLNTSGQITLLPSVVGGSSNDNCNIVSDTVFPNFFTCIDTGLTTVTYQAFDQSGNTAQCTATVTIADSTRPMAACNDTLVYLDPFGNASITAASVENGSTDNCTIDNFSVNQTSFSCLDVPGQMVTVSVVDVSGNIATCTAYVRVEDTVAPVALCRDSTIYIDNSGMANLVPANIDNGSSDNCAIDSIWMSQTNFTCLDTGINNITLFVSDADTNLSTCISLITVLDTVPPSAACSDTTFYLDPSGVATVDPMVFGINSFDNCNFFDSIYVNVGPFACVDTGQHPVTLYVVDINLSIDSCSGTVTILDTLPPTMLCQNISVILSPAGTVSITAAMIDTGTSDNCTMDTVFLDIYDFTCSDVGANTVTLTGLDIYGNSANCTAIVDVQDSVAPVANCQAFTTYLDGAGQTQVVVADVNNGSSDNCQIDTLFLSQMNFTCLDTGINVDTLFVQDTDGNISFCLANVTVLDTISPTPLCVNDTAYLDGNGVYTLAASTLDGGGTDNCGISNIALSQSAFDCADIGTNSVVLTFVDPSGNTANCAATLTVLDTLPPVAVCNDTTLYLSAAGSLTITVADVANASSDNCGIATSSVSQTSFSCGDIGINNLTVSFTDTSGNASNCAVNLTVLDTVAPVATCLNPTLYLNASGIAILTTGQVDGGSTDACGIDSIYLNQDTFLCSNVGLNATLLQVRDSSGNIGTCTASVTVLDTIAPQVTCSTATVFLDSTGNYMLNSQVLIASSSDVCSIALSYGFPSMFNCTNIGPNVVMVYVEDPSGNLDSCQTTLTIQDNIAPIALCDSIELQLDTNGLAVLLPTMLGSASSDNCGIDSFAVSQSVFDCGDQNWTAVTLTLIDSSGNISSCIGHVRTIDSTGASIVNVDLGPDTTACNGDVLIFDAGPATSYIWSTSATTQTISVNSAGTYSVTVTNSRGCIGVDSVIVQTFNTPNPNLRTESGELVVCLNDSLKLIVDPLFSSYLWSTGETGNEITVTTGGNYTVSVTDANGCGLLESLNINFAPFPAPNPSITPPGPLGMCENTSLTLNAGAGYAAYLWTTGQTSQTITAFIPNTYGVQVWNGFGCHTVAPPVVITQLLSPYPDINQNGDTLFTNTLGQTYQWYLGTVPILGAVNSRYVGTLNGSYKVRVYYANGCNAISNGLAFIVGATEAISELNGIEVYPNPSNGSVTLNPKMPIRDALSLRVTDLYGKLIFEDSKKHLLNPLELDLRGNAAGIYLLEIETQKGRVSHKLILE